MRSTLLAHGLLAVFCQSVSGLQEGTYRISPPRNNTQLLTRASAEDNKPVEFQSDGSMRPFEEDLYKVWNVTSNPEEKDTFLIASVDHAGPLNCGSEEGSICTVGTDKSQAFKVESEGNNNYRLVAQSGLYLRIRSDRKVETAKADHSRKQVFKFTPDHLKG